MYRAIVSIPLLLITIASATRDLPVPSQPRIAHSDQTEAYASAIVGVMRAEEICRGYRSKPAALTALRARMAIRGRDGPEVSRQALKIERKVSTQIETFGVASWCASILVLFGPNGTLAAGLLELR